MPARLALGLLLVYVLVTFGLRTLLHKRRHGSWGLHGISGKAGSPSWFGGLAFIAALVLVLLAPLAAWFGWLAPLVAPSDALVAAGVALALVGSAGTWWSQAAMGASWRVGVDERERTALVVRGPFAYVRNPIFTFMTTTALGVTLLAPNLAGAAAVALLVAAIELQVRTVEEPYLRSVHGDAFARYCARTGRFLPFVGRMPLR